MTEGPYDDLATAQVCIVGGGPAGMALARALLRHGVAFELFERHSDVGGLWDRDNPGSPVYDSAHFISSKTMSHYVGDPMPDDYPDYPSHRQILAYLRAFADTYDLRRHMTFGVGVEAATPVDLPAEPEAAARTPTRGWSVQLSTGETRVYRHLVAATGTNWHPTLPAYEGVFDGDYRHSQTYHSMEEFRGKRVLIIGAGNSGCDIACDAAQAADRAAISMRRGYYFIPKHIFGVPADVFAEKGPRVPMWLEQRVFTRMLRVMNGDTTRLGLPEPDHKLFETHPIMNTQILHFLGHGDLSVKPDVARFDGPRVVFVDGSSEEFDLVLGATGYRWDIPWLPRSALPWTGDRPDLYLNLFAREDPTLYGMGFIETNGGAYKLFDDTADLVARTIAARLAGDGSAAGIEALIAGDHPDLRGGIRHMATPRHATYVESATYRAYLQQVRRKLGWPALTPDCFDGLRR